MTTSPPFSVPPSPPAGRNRRRVLSCAIAAAAGIMLWQGAAYSFGRAEEATVIAPPVQDEAPGTSHSETAVLAGGCFWGVQGVFEHVQGVQRVVSGYAGGVEKTAHYETVSGGDTGHAESVQVTFDPTQVSYGSLLQIFFSVAHDPTEVNRQGPDSGTQYRSAIFPTTEQQQHIAQAYIAQLNASHAFHAAIATHVEDNVHFYPAEDYHQDFLVNNPSHPYIVINDLPKIEQLKHLFPTRYSEQPVLVSKP